MIIVLRKVSTETPYCTFSNLFKSVKLSFILNAKQASFKYVFFMVDFADLLCLHLWKLCKKIFVNRQKNDRNITEHFTFSLFHEKQWKKALRLEKKMAIEINQIFKLVFTHFWKLMIFSTTSLLIPKLIFGWNDLVLHFFLPNLFYSVFVRKNLIWILEK